MNIPIKVDPQGAEQKIGGVERSLAKLEDEAKAAQLACNSLSGTFKRIADHERAMAAETAKVKTAMDGLGGSFARIGQSQVDQKMIATGKAMAGLTAQIAHEQKVLESIHGPMKQYQQDVQTLEMLQKRGAITASEHAAALAQSRARAGVGNPSAAVGLNFKAQNLGPMSGRDMMAGAGSAMMGVGIAGFAAKSVLDLSDSYTSLENRLRKVSGSQGDLNALMDKTKGIADRTRSDWGATAESYVRLIGATKQLGLSQERGLAITETLNMALQSSGASSSEAAAGTLQLMQGLSAGALAGDEFRSISESLPDLMDVFAKQLGVTRGELKKLGSEGKITTDVVIKGLEAASGTIRDDFNKSTATASQQFTVLKNQAMQTAGTFVQSTGALSILGDVLGGVGSAMSFFGQATGAVRGALEKLGPVGDVIKTGLGLVVSPLTTTIKVIDKLDGGFYELAKAADAATVPLKGLDPALSVAAHKFRNANDPVLALTKNLQAQHDKLNTARLSFDAITPSIDAVSAAMRRLGIVGDAWSDTSAFSAFDEFARKFKAGLDLVNAINAPTKTYTEATANLSAQLASGAITVTDYTYQLKAANDALFSADPALAAVAAQHKNAGKAVKEHTAWLREHAEEIKLLNSAAGPQRGKPTNMEPYKGYNHDAYVQAEVDRLTAEANAVREPDLEADLAAHRDVKYAPQGGNSLDGGIKQATEQLTKFDLAVQELNDGAMQNLQASAQAVGDAFVDWMFDAEFSWKRFSEQMAKDMAKMAVRQGIQFAFSSLGGGATGFDSMVGGGRGAFLPGFATGGDMLVGGAGGTDSRIAAFRVTPGESIHVRTPEQRQAANSNGRGRTVIVENHDGSRSRYVMADDIEELVIRSVDRNAPALRNRLTGR